MWLTLVLTLGAALWLGAWSNKDWGFLVGAALGYLVAQRWALGARLEELSRRLLALEARKAAPAPAEPAAQPAPRPAPTVPSAEPAATPPPPTAPAPAVAAADQKGAELSPGHVLAPGPRDAAGLSEGRV
jgi:hypothetical protein